jgi:glycosyltransferase involved in cell wall biosynthesis
MMAGLPCVAAAVGGISEAVGTAAMVVPPEDVDALTASLRRLVLSWDERQTLGAAAHRRASDRLSLERMVADTVAVYDEVLSPLRP